MLPQFEESPASEETVYRAGQRTGSSSRALSSLFAEEPADLGQVLQIFADILALLDSIHRQGLQHDLLSPTSIRLSENGGPEIRTRNDSLDSSETVAVADPKYALPESFWEGPENVSCAVSDSYLLGFIFYELFLGRRRFRAQFAAFDSSSAVVWLGWHADRSRRLAPLTQLLPNFPRSLSKVIEEMTEKDPAKRAAEFQGILHALSCAGETTFAPGAQTGADGQRTVVSEGPQKQQFRSRLANVFGFTRKHRQKPSAGGARKEPFASTLDDALRDAEDRLQEASTIAGRALEHENNGQLAEALKQWTLVRETYPNFPNLEANIRRLQQLSPEPVAEELAGADSRTTYQSPHPKTEVFDQVFEERHAAVSRRTSTGAKLVAWLVVVLLLWAGGFFLSRFLQDSNPAAPLFPVEFQANAPGVQFAIDGRPTRSASVKLPPGAHRAEAAAPGYGSQSKAFTVSEKGSPPVVFVLQSLAPSLRVTTPFRGAKYILDGDDAIDLDNGSFTEDHLVSGIHSLRILTEDKQVFSLNFTSEPQKMPEIKSHSEPDNISALISSSFKDSAKFYATQDWKLSSEDGSSRAIAADGLDIPPPSKGNAQIVAASVDGDIQKLNIATSTTPLLSIFLRRLPPRIPVALSANVADAAVILNGRRSDQLMVNGQTMLSLFPGVYRVKLTHRDYYDSPIQEITLSASKADPVQLQFILKPANAGALVGFTPETNGADVLVDGVPAHTSRAAGRLTLLLQAGHHIITVKKRHFEDLSISRDFAPGELLDFSLSGMKQLAALTFKLNPESAVILVQGAGGEESVSSANGATVALPAGEYTITASAPDFETVTRTLSLESGKTFTLRLILIPQDKAKDIKLVRIPTLDTSHK